MSFKGARMNPSDGTNRQSMLDRFRAAARIDADRRQAFTELCNRLGRASAPFCEAWPTLDNDE